MLVQDVMQGADVLELFLKGSSDRSGHKDVVIRIGSIDARPAIAELEARGFLVGNPKKG